MPNKMPVIDQVTIAMIKMAPKEAMRGFTTILNYIAEYIELPEQAEYTIVALLGKNQQ